MCLDYMLYVQSSLLHSYTVHYTILILGTHTLLYCTIHSYTYTHTLVYRSPLLQPGAGDEAGGGGPDR